MRNRPYISFNEKDMIKTFSLALAFLASLSLAGADGKPIPVPELTSVSEWINSKPLKIADLKGKVVVVHFWTHGCINCVRNYEHYRAWTTQFEKVPEFAMIGIHTPEFDSEKNVERIKQKAKDNKLTFPIAVDNDSKNWQAWGNQY
jgi:peroxiredoxin